MVAGALAAAGIYAGRPEELLAGQEDNPRGFWERKELVALNDELLAACGSASWFKPPHEMTAPRAPLAQRMRELVQRLPTSTSWLLKDPRLTLTWPLWREQFAGADLVFVYRDPAAVASSLRRRHQFPLALGLSLWEYYNRLAIGILQEAGGIAVSYDDFAADPDAALGDLLARLDERDAGCGPVSEAGVFDSALNHADPADAALVEGLLTGSQRRLRDYCAALCAGRALPDFPPASGHLRASIDDMAGALAPLAELAVVKQQVRELTERTRERDVILAQLRSLETEHEALAQAHHGQTDELEKSRAGLEDARTQFKTLETRHASLAAAYDAQAGDLEKTRTGLTETQVRLEDARTQLDETYRDLLDFEFSTLAGVWRFVARCYKLLTFRRDLKTTYDDALERARRHFSTNQLPMPQKPQRKISLLGDVLQYVLRNPAGSARSFSLPRLKRAAAVFLRSSPDDLEVWVNSRFPQKENADAALVNASLDESLDSLELVFPPCDAPVVSIVVPVFNDYRFTIQCLQSVLDNTPDVAFEVIVADDNSSDLTRSIADRVKNIRIVRSGVNRGFLANCNEASAVSRGRYILFLNNDTVVCPDWLQPMLRVAENDPQVGIVGPKLLFANGRLQEAGGIMWRDGSAWNYGRMDNPEKPEYNYLKETDYISGACLLVKAGLWRQLGGFDNRYAPAYYEDADLAFQTRAAGHKVIYQPLSRVFHYEGVSNGTSLDAGVKRFQAINQRKFRDKWQNTLENFHFVNADHVFLARDRSRQQRCILFIDHYVPHYDKDAGSRSTFMYIRLMLAMGYRVLFLGANFFPHKPYTETLQQLGVEVLVGEYMARNQDRWLQENAAYIDRIYLHRPHIAEQVIDSLERMHPKPQIIYFGHDLHYLRVERELQLSADDALVREARSWRKREYAIFDRVDKIYYPSQVEVDEILRHKPQLDVSAIPLYALRDITVPQFDFAHTRGLLFVGGFNHPPNVDGIGWFAEQILPRLVDRCPDIHLHVVGSNPPDAVQSLQSERITVYGYLPDDELHAIYRKVRQVVVPLRFGAGIKGKVLEAIQQGVPLVTTSVGAEGIPEAESVMAVADTPEALADAIVALYTDESLATAKLGEYADWLRRHFGEERATRIILRDFGPPSRSDCEEEHQPIWQGQASW
jgi:GT2 family glycosyltransferase